MYSDFIAGNEYLYRITNSAEYSLKVILTGNTKQEMYDSEYTIFKIGSEESGYKLAELSGNTGSAGDILGLFSSTSLIHAPFKTYEINRNENNDNENGGWWYPEVLLRKGANSSLPQSGSFHYTDKNTQTMDRNCYSHLNAAKPWFCNVDGQKQYVRTVHMYIRSARSN